MQKKRIRLTEGQLRSVVKECVKKVLREGISDIPTRNRGGKYYQDDDPEKSKQSVSAGADERTRIMPSEFERLGNTYDSDFGYDYDEGNPEPICYDPEEGLCYGSGEYYPNDSALQRDYAKYGEYMRDKYSPERGDYRNRDIEDAWDEENPWGSHDGNTGLMNLLDRPYDAHGNGELAMRALDGDEFSKSFTDNTLGNTPMFKPVKNNMMRKPKRN